MKLKSTFLKAILSLLILIMSFGLNAQRNMENLNRGTVAVRPNTSQVLVSWRILGTEYASGATYNLYRGSTLIASNLSVSNYIDATSTDYSYSVAAVINGTEQSKSTAVSPLANQYFKIPVRAINGGYTTYNVNDASVGDLDGDGEYEIVVKRLSNDNSIASTTYHYLEAYKLDGTFMWAINLGPNLNNEVEINFLVYDFDNDGKAEVVTRTSDGMIDGTGVNIGDRDRDGKTNYRSTMVLNSSYYRIDGPDYISVFNGQTGKEIAWNWYITRAPLSQWGTAGMSDSQLGHRAEKCMFAVAYLDGVNPSIVISRGIYHRIKMEAWNYGSGTLTKKWAFDSDPNGVATAYTGQGYHNLAAGDIDGDGKDEIVYGSMAVSESGTGIYSTGFGHGDAGHLADINPNSSGLEFFGCLEGANGSTIPGIALRNAATGAIKWQYMTSGDDGRCMAADVDANYVGMEIWGADGSGLYSCTGTKISSTLPTTAGGGATYNFGVWWDGDVQRELLDRTVITKWNASSQSTDRVATLYNLTGISDNNSSKSNPCLMADILGDWREEVIYRCSDNSGMIVFVTPFSTSQRMYTLMHDPNYRLAIAWQNNSYNQPPNLGFYFGGGMSTPPSPNIKLVGVCTASTITPYIQVDGGSWSQSTSATVSAGGTVKFGPQPTSGGTWSWSGPNSYSASTREITLSAVTTSMAGNYVATYTNSCGAKTTATFVVSVTSGTSTLTIQENGTGFCSVDGTVDSNNSGYTGTGFANTTNGSGYGISWTINAPSAGSYTLKWRYANISGDRTAQLKVDGTVVVSSISFASTGSWTTWTETSGTTVTLSAGNHVIRIEATQTAGLGNIDYISVTGINPTGVSCTGVKSAISENVNFENNTDFNLFPVPARSNVTVKIMGTYQNSKINIVSVNGKLLKSIIPEGENVPVDVSDLANGLYFVQMVTEKGIKVKEMIKQ